VREPRTRLDLGRLAFRGGPFALVLAVILVLVYPLSLEQAGWVTISGHYTWLAILGLIFGALVGNSTLRRDRALLLGGVIGILAVVTLTTAAAGEGPFRAKLGTLAVNVNSWLTQIMNGEAGTDPTVFILSVAATCWTAPFLGGFALQRYRRPWDLLVVPSFCLIVNVSLALRPLLLDLVFFSVIAMLLLVRLHVVALSERWGRRNLVPAGDMDWRVLRAGLTWTFALVIFAFATPRVGAAEALSNAWNTFEGPWHAVENEWQRFFAGVYGPSRLQGVSFADVIRLGQAPNLGDRVAMHVTANEGRFWRATAYDFYTGVGWKSTDDKSADRAEPQTFSRRAVLRATFEVQLAHGNLLFAPNEPHRIGVPASFSQSGDDRTFSSSVRAKDRSQAAGTYLVMSLVSTATKDELRAAGNQYPAVITDRYLQVPSSVPQRVRDLARQQTRGQQTAYDKAEAIERFLRTTYRYSPVVKTPPGGRDPVDWFLFDLREDFCEYFASAMVIMLRDLGVPARLVEGYTTGQFDPTIGKYVVREANAHAWVEVYFPSYGWIEFEPTPSEATIARPEGAAVGEGGGSGTDGGDEPGGVGGGQFDEELFPDEGEGDFGFVPEAAARPPDYRPLGIVGILAVLFAIGAWIRFELRFRRMPAAEAAFGKMRLLGSYVGMRQRPHQTTYEYASSLGGALPRIREDIEAIAEARVHQSYAPAGASEVEAQRARDAWRRVSLHLLGHLPRRVVRTVRDLL
jgi:transglutaminase-like putative cysteine protease